MFWKNMTLEESLWFVLLMSVVFFSAGLCVFMRRHCQKQLKEQETLTLHLYNLINMVSECAMIVDEHGQIIHTNQALLKNYNTTAKWLEGKNIQRLNIGFNYLEHQEAMNETFRHGGVYHLVVEYTRPDDTVIPFEASIAENRIDGKLFYSVVASDIKTLCDSRENYEKQTEKLMEIEHIAQMGYWEIDHQTRKVRWSKELYHILGYDTESTEPTLDILYSMVSPEDQNRSMKLFIDAFQKQEPIDTQLKMVCQNGKRIQVSMRIRHAFSEAGEHLATIGLVQNVTELKLLETNLDFQTRFSKAVIDHSDLLVLTTDCHDIILDINPFIKELTGCSRTELLGRPALKIFGHVGKRYMNRLTQMGNYNGPLELKDKNGEVRYIIWKTTELPYKSDSMVRVSVGLDVTESVKLRYRYKKLAYTDHITGLPNWMKFTEVLDRYCEKYAERSEKSMSVLFIALVDFQEISELYGYQRADQVLTDTCRRLTERVGSIGMLARHEHNFLTLFLPGCSSREKVTPICRQILEVLNTPSILAGQRYVLGGQIGIARYPLDARDRDVLLRYGEAAMNRARQDASIDWYFFDDTLKARINSDILRCNY